MPYPLRSRPLPLAHNVDLDAAEEEQQEAEAAVGEPVELPLDLPSWRPSTPPPSPTSAPDYLLSTPHKPPPPVVNLPEPPEVISLSDSDSNSETDPFVVRRLDSSVP